MACIYGSGKNWQDLAMGKELGELILQGTEKNSAGPGDTRRTGWLLVLGKELIGTTLHARNRQLARLGRNVSYVQDADKDAEITTEKENYLRNAL